MATVVVNGSKLGAQRLSGAQAFQLTRGAGITGDATIAFDTTKITTRGQLNDFVRQALPTLLDQLK